jgi:hypothetical protein
MNSRLFLIVPFVCVVAFAVVAVNRHWVFALVASSNVKAAIRQAVTISQPSSVAPRESSDKIAERIVKAGFSRSLLEVDKQCHRVLMPRTEPGGLGHRVSALVFAIIAANATRSTLCLQPNFFGEYSHHSHAGYTW